MWFRAEYPDVGEAPTEVLSGYSTFAKVNAPTYFQKSEGAKNFTSNRVY